MMSLVASTHTDADIFVPVVIPWAFPGGWAVKNLPAVQRSEFMIP